MHFFAVGKFFLFDAAINIALKEMGVGMGWTRLYGLFRVLSLGFNHFEFDFFELDEFLLKRFIVVWNMVYFAVFITMLELWPTL